MSAAMLALLLAALAYARPAIEVHDYHGPPILPHEHGVGDALISRRAEALAGAGGQCTVRFYQPSGDLSEVLLEETLHCVAYRHGGQWTTTLDPTGGGSAPRDDAAHSWTRWATAHPVEATVRIERIPR